MKAHKAIVDLETLFRQQGFSPVKAEVWANFVRHTFQIYWEAADLLLKAEYWSKFKTKRGAIGKPKKQKGKFFSVPIEDAITSEIGHLANTLRSSLPDKHFLRLHEVKFEFEAFIYSETRSGRHSRKVDFRVSAQTGGDAPSIAIEAKPLVNSSDIGSRYLAEEGIGCFFSAESAYTSGPLGGMFAYTVNDLNKSMKDELHSAMFAYLPKPTAINKIPLLNEEWVTCTSHSRNHDLQPILILHVERIFPAAENTALSP